MSAKITRENSVKHVHGHRKWYQAILYQFFGRIRESRRKFKRASEAQRYAAQVQDRLNRFGRR
jgi:hypothetical protein